jgi:hypothetical protein
MAGIRVADGAIAIASENGYCGVHAEKGIDVLN